MRFFVALEIANQNKQELTVVQQKLKQLIPQAKLTDPEKLHLTIAFIGERPDTFKDKLIEVLKIASLNISPFSVTPSYIDGFPHLHTANILWVGVNGDIDELYKLRHHVKDGLSRLSLLVDPRRFVPHIAIAKLNNFHLNPSTEKGLEKIISGAFSPITVTKVMLFESIPSHGFHQHNTLAEIKLG